MTDQCIICLEDLNRAGPDHPPATATATAAAEGTDPAALTGALSSVHGLPGPPPPPPPLPCSRCDNDLDIARISPCGHVLHDACLRAWSQKANSCPICRSAFNLVAVLDKVGGTALSEYHVDDKKQVAEFDSSVWIEENPEEEADLRPCPICSECTNEDVLLLCDRCDAPYHTFCIGLDRVPRGQWFCMECAAEGAYLDAAATEQASRQRHSRRTFPRTQAEQRESRRRTRPDQWLGAWSRFSRTVHDVAGLDLDFSDSGEDESPMHTFRHHQHNLSAEARNRESRDQWRQRIRIAERQGAREDFGRVAPWRQVQAPAPRPPAPETVEQTQAWKAFDQAKESRNVTPRGRKRKSRSVSTTPEASSAPKERKLKRPRTRRLPEFAGPSSLQSQSSASRAAARRRVESASRSRNATDNEPSFLSSLLREVETANTPDVSTPISLCAFETLAVPSRPTSPPMDFSSPGSSPSPVSPVYHTPRALSTTPPPPGKGQRSNSPAPLTSRIEPLYPHPQRRSTTDSAQPSSRAPRSTNGLVSSSSRVGTKSSHNPDIRHPQPVRRTPEKKLQSRSRDASPARLKMTSEAKESVNKFVKAALHPHWKRSDITKEQYANINRDVSRMLYEQIADRSLADEKARRRWEAVAVNQVDSAVKALA